MDKKSNKKTKINGKKSQWSPWHYLVIVGIVLMLFVFLRGNYGFIKYVQLLKQKRELTKDIENLKAQSETLKKEINQLLYDYSYIEKIVREKYKMGKTGEKIYFLIPQQDEKSTQKQK